MIRFDADTGSFVDVFVAAGSGGIADPDGMYFGPDCNSDGVPELYVTGWLSHSVVRYDGATGESLGNYITPGSGGLSYPFAMVERGNELFVTSAGTNQILKYNVTLEPTWVSRPVATDLTTREVLRLVPTISCMFPVATMTA